MGLGTHLEFSNSCLRSTVFLSCSSFSLANPIFISHRTHHSSSFPCVVFQLSYTSAHFVSYPFFWDSLYYYWIAERFLAGGLNYSPVSTMVMKRKDHTSKF